MKKLLVIQHDHTSPLGPIAEHFALFAGKTY